MKDAAGVYSIEPAGKQRALAGTRLTFHRQASPLLPPKVNSCSKHQHQLQTTCSQRWKIARACEEHCIFNPSQVQFRLKYRECRMQQNVTNLSKWECECCGKDWNFLKFCCPALHLWALTLATPVPAPVTSSSALHMHSRWWAFYNVHSLICLLPMPPNPLCCSFHCPRLPPRTSFPISLPDAASRPFQILPCRRTKAAQMWIELALGMLTALSSCLSGMVVLSLWDQRQKKKVGVKKKTEKKDWGQKKERRQNNHWNKKEMHECSFYLRKQ